MNRLRIHHAMTFAAMLCLLAAAPAAWSQTDDALAKKYYQLGKELSADDTADIAAFLGSLTGRIDESYIARPEPLPSGPDTPDPDPS